MPTDYDLVASAYSSFNARDIDSVLRTMHKDVDWPNGMEGGRVSGQQTAEPSSKSIKPFAILAERSFSTRWCNTSISYGKGSFRAWKFAPASPPESR